MAIAQRDPSTLNDDLLSRFQVQCRRGEDTDKPTSRCLFFPSELLLGLLVHGEKLLLHVFAYSITFVGTSIGLNKGTELDPLLELLPQ
jgi:hypothetical protein